MGWQQWHIKKLIDMGVGWLHSDKQLDLHICHCGSGSGGKKLIGTRVGSLEQLKMVNWFFPITFCLKDLQLAQVQVDGAGPLS